MKLRGLVTLAAGLSVATLTLACSSDGGDNSGNGGATGQGGNTAQGGAANGGSGTGGSAQGGNGTGGSAQGGSGQGGAANGGSGTGGSAQGGSGTGGSAQGGKSSGGANSGGTSTGGGSSGGRAGGSGQGGGNSAGAGGGGTATFTQVASLLGMKCAGSSCHGNGSSQLNLVDMSGLYMRLTTPIAGSVPHCKGTTLVVPNDAAGSFLVKVVKGSAMCTNGTAMESIARMPDHCTVGGSGTSGCLTDAQVKLISDWIAAGAKE